MKIKLTLLVNFILTLTNYKKNEYIYDQTNSKKSSSFSKKRNYRTRKYLSIIKKTNIFMIRQIVKKAAHFQRKEIIVPENIYLK